MLWIVDCRFFLSNLNKIYNLLSYFIKLSFTDNYNNVMLQIVLCFLCSSSTLCLLLEICMQLFFCPGVYKVSVRFRRARVLTYNKLCAVLQLRCYYIHASLHALNITIIHSKMYLSITC